MQGLLTVKDVEAERLLREALEEDDEPEPKIARPLAVADVRRVFDQVLDWLEASFGMNATVNELLRRAAVFVELEGWVGPALLERRLRVNRHIAKALIETLRDQGLLREAPSHWQEPREKALLTRAVQREIRAESHVKSEWLDARRVWRRQGTCKGCGREYERQSRSQRYCPECREVRQPAPSCYV